MPRHVPLTVTHPPVTEIPPENVDVDVLVTERFVIVVVASDVLRAEKDPEIDRLDRPVIDPPVIVGLVIDVPESWSIR